MTLTALCLAGLACSDDGGGGESAETAETSGDGDGDAGDGDGDGSENSDADMGDGDGDGDGDTGEPDMDMDGVPDGADNCPADPNPNQLDFDDNGTGNVCDTQVFTSVSGTLNTTASADAGGFGNCQIPLMLEVESGQILVQLDDEAAVAGFEIVELQLADVLDQVCQLALPASVDLTDFVIANSGGPLPVSVAHSLDQHDAGQVAGDSDVPHPVLSTAMISASIGDMAQEPAPLELDGALPTFTSNITGAGAMGTLAWADAQFVLATDEFMVDAGFEVNIEFALTGLTGALTVGP